MENNTIRHPKMTEREGATVLPEEECDLLKLQFTDLFGQMKMVEMPAASFGRIESKGIRIDAGALAQALGGRGDECNKFLYLVPELKTCRVYPWDSGQGNVAGIFCRVTDETGSTSWADSRTVFGKLVEKADALGLSISVGFQSDFYLFHTDEEGRPTTVTHEAAGYYDAGSIDLADNVRREMLLSLLEAGIEVESAFHGMTPGQNSFILAAKSACEAADCFQIFKAAVKRIAKRNGLHAAFMPKPLMEGGDCGLRVKILVEKNSRMLTGEEFEKRSQMFCAGIASCLDEVMIFTNASVNSYRRLCGKGIEDEFAVAQKAGEGKCSIEMCHPDASSNIYLSLSALVAAGLDGIGRDLLSETEAHKEVLVKGKDMPSDLGAALRQFSVRKNSYLQMALGEKLCREYAAGKENEWRRFCSCVTDWEIREYLCRC